MRIYSIIVKAPIPAGAVLFQKEFPSLDGMNDSAQRCIRDYPNAILEMWEKNGNRRPARFCGPLQTS